MENCVVGVLKSIVCMWEGDESLNKTTTYVFAFLFGENITERIIIFFHTDNIQFGRKGESLHNICR